MDEVRKETEEQCARMIAALWKDENLKERFVASPKEVMKEHSITPPDKEIVVLEDTDSRIHIVIPQSSCELSDEDLEGIAGGADFLGDAMADLLALGKSIAGSLVSDEKFKEDIRDLEGALEKTLALRGVSFKWRREEFPEMGFDGGSQIGLIAQEVETVFPDLVDNDDRGYKTLQYANLVAVMVEAIKTQQCQIEDIRRQLGDSSPDEVERRALSVQTAG